MRAFISVAGCLSLVLAAANAQAAAVTLVNDGFEAAWTATSSAGQDSNVRFNYKPTGTNMGWTFGAGTGVVNPLTANVAAQDGSQYAFLQNASGRISQTFNLAQGGLADVSFLYGLRPFYDAGQGLQVFLDNQLVSTFTAANVAPLSWSSANFSLGTLAAGNHTLAFAGTGFAGSADTTMFLDKVAVNVSAVPEPSSALMLSLGLGGLLLARRRQA